MSVIDVLEIDDRLAGLEIVADADLAQAEHAVEGRDDRHLVEPGLRQRDRRLVVAQVGGRLVHGELRAGAALAQRLGALHVRRG